ncbi:hypothetical protein BDV29DRAFT_45611 [Aspergillus leporis]|jgi:hypothetical protein|uniref:Uncharacterized protein n=1 Tax=Aspergillus leporis TaxID=41062 RepID=A0A5N5XAB8_9EURO|nr:hypothetical protein BDV29DRAFT_45611 [Aspergillus leporis]
MANTLEEFVQLEPLWDKAILSPAEISLEEKHQLMEWPPLAEMQGNAHKHLGLSVEDLIQKAATAPLSLTYSECRLIRDNFRILRLGDMSNRWIWPLKRPDLETKRTQAQAAILTSKELQALRNLDEVFYEKEKTELDGREAKRQRRPAHMPKEWVQKIIDEGDDKSWGYIFYHHKAMVGWDDFKELFDGILAMPLFGVKGSEEIQGSKVAEFVEFETKDEGELDYLRQDFRSRRERGGFKPGILKNVFFLLTDEARLSYGIYGQEEYYGHIWAIDPDWPLPGADEDGHDGRLKISATQVFWRFYEFMSTDNFTLKDIWRDFHDVNSTKVYPSYFSEPTAWHFTNLDKPAWPYA